MREVASLASAYGHKHLPVSLMQRLALMQHFAHVAQVSEQSERAPQPRRVRRGAHVIILAWFSLGVITSGAIGAATIVGLRAKAAGAAPLATIASMASTAWAAWAKAPAAAPATPPTAAPVWDTVEITVDRAERTRMPLPLEVTGADAAGTEVLLQGLPAGVTPSRGAPRGPVWVLGRDDLDGLALTLDATAPDAFDLRISLAAAPGTTTGGSIVQVRLVDPAPQAQAVANADAGTERLALSHPGGADGPAAQGAPAAQPVAAAPAAASEASRPAAGAGGKAAHRRTTVAAGEAQADRRRPWPEGASALGAVSRQSDGPSWWQMPPPSWSPFVVGQERP